MSIENMDMSNVETEKPVLADNQVLSFLVQEVTATPTKRGEGSMVNIALRNESPDAISTKDKPVRVGELFFDSVYFPNEPKEDFHLQAMKRLAKACQVDESQVGPFDKYAGKTVRAKVKVKVDEEYGDKNRFRYLKQGA